MPKQGRTPGLHAARYRRKTGPDAWYATGSALDGKKVRLEGVTTKRAAEREILRIWQQKFGRRASITIGEAIDDYLDMLARKHELKKIVLSTRRQLERAARLVVEVVDGSRAADGITKDDLFAIREAAEGRAERASTARKYLIQTRQALRWLRKKGVLDLTSDEIEDCLEPGESAIYPPPFWLRPEEILEVLELAGDDPRPRLLLLTGMRKGELHQLRWDSGVQLRQRTIKHVFGSRTKRSRTIDLRVIPSVEAWLREHERPAGKVFPGALSTLNQSLARVFLDLRKAAPGLKPKDLRSTCASYLHCALGIPLTVHQKARQLGHSIAVAESRYAGEIRTIDPRATTLEQAMGLAPVTRPTPEREERPLNGRVRPIDYQRKHVE